MMFVPFSLFVSSRLGYSVNAVRGLHFKVANTQRGLLKLGSPLRGVVKAGKGSTSAEVRAQAEKEMLAYWERNLGREKPLSPHILTYSPPLVMRFSFIHRFTGTAMAFIWVFFGISAFWFTGHYDQMIDFVKALSLGPAVIAGCKFLVAYFPCYHCLNGVRHLAWDNAMGFPIKTCNRTGFTVLSLSVLCAAALAMLRVEA